jgi:hypothetical protein
MIDPYYAHTEKRLDLLALKWPMRRLPLRFFLTEAKTLPHPLIKKKIAQFISGKSGENHHNR